MRWAFWRGWAAARPSDEDSAPDSVTPSTSPIPTPTGPLRPPTGDEDEREDDSPARPAFSGADPDAALHARPRHPRPVGPHDEPGALDRARLGRSGAAVADAVRAVLADEAAALSAALQAARDPAATRAAAAAAAGVLAARLPALSGVDGSAVDEADQDLLHAYADLLAERAEVRRARLAPDVPREQLLVVAHLAAVAAADDAASEPGVLVLGGMAAQEQLVAGCLLLAQTCADGGGSADHLPQEVADLFG